MSPMPLICSHCGKPLDNQTCFACEGNGYSREFLLIHKECDVCKGSGRIWRCEDEFKHIVDDFKSAHKVEHKPLSQVQKIVPKFSQHSSTTPQIPLAWPMHAENPWNLNNSLGAIKTINANHLNNSGHPLNRNNPISRNAVKK